MRASRYAYVLIAAGLVAGAITTSASADPRNGEVIPLTCDNDRTYIVTVNGNGEFTPGHDTQSTAMLIPVSFGRFTGTVTDPEGNVVEEIDEPPAFKGQSGKNAKNTTVTCEFSFTETEDGFTFTASGSVTGFVTPRGKG